MSRRSVGSRRESPWQKESTWPVPTGSPAARSTRPNPASAGRTWVTPPSPSGIGEDPAEVAPDPYEIVVVLDNGPERYVDHVVLEARRAEEGKGPRPLDGLGDTGALHEVDRADALDRCGHPAGEIGGGAGGGRPEGLAPPPRGRGGGSRIKGPPP